MVPSQIPGDKRQQGDGQLELVVWKGGLKDLPEKADCAHPLHAHALPSEILFFFPSLFRY